MDGRDPPGHDELAALTSRTNVIRICDCPARKQARERTYAVGTTEPDVVML